MNKLTLKLILPLGALLIVGAAIIFAPAKQTPGASSGSGQQHEVTLTDNGFTPDPITIHAGDTITFRTNRGKPFWPASNLHPTHEIYPEFDPKRPIDPTDSWSFQFNKVGTWRYHDHLSPLFTGTINVL